MDTIVFFLIPGNCKDPASTDETSEARKSE